MSWLAENSITFICYAFLFLSAISLWFPRRKNGYFWLASFVVAIGFGLISGAIEPLALVPILLFGSAVYCIQQQKIRLILRIPAGIIVLLLGAAFMMHLVPGFHNVNVLHRVYISKDAIPFSLYLNIDQAVVGILLLGFCHQRIATGKEWLLLFKQTIPWMLGIIFIVSVLSLALHFVQFDAKLPRDFFVWAIANLLIVCLAEEAFFRGFIQHYSARVIGHYAAILLAALLFGLRHYPGGIKYMILATIAGIGYGWIYVRTKHIEGSIVTHFGLNVVHILFFTYPALATAVLH